VGLAQLVTVWAAISAGLKLQPKHVRNRLKVMVFSDASIAFWLPVWCAVVFTVWVGRPSLSLLQLLWFLPSQLQIVHTGLISFEINNRVLLRCDIPYFFSSGKEDGVLSPGVLSPRQRAVEKPTTMSPLPSSLPSPI
jgi:hypothetical protein